MSNSTDFSFIQLLALRKRCRWTVYSSWEECC